MKNEKGHLTDFYIDFKRVMKKYKNKYYDLDSEISSIMIPLSLLLNDYLLSDLEIIDICINYDMILLHLRKHMEEEDYFDLVREVFYTLDNDVKNDLIRMENYEQCHNIRNFIDTYVKCEY